MLDVSRCGYKSALVNPDLTLEALKLDTFRGVYPQRKPFHLMLLGVTRDAGVKLLYEQRQSTPLDSGTSRAYSSSNLNEFGVYINGVHVSDGTGKGPKNAKQDSSRNAYLYLIAKGLQYYLLDNVSSDASMVVEKDGLMKNGTSPEQIDNTILTLLQRFDSNPDLLKLEIDISNIGADPRQAIHKLGDMCGLRHKNKLNASETLCTTVWRLDNSPLTVGKCRSRAHVTVNQFYQSISDLKHSIPHNFLT